MQSFTRVSRTVGRSVQSQKDLCTAFCSLYIASRGLTTSAVRSSMGGSNNATPNPMHSAPPATTKRDDKARSTVSQPEPRKKIDAAAVNAAQTATEYSQRAQEKMKQQQEMQQQQARSGGLAGNSLFADQDLPSTDQLDESETGPKKEIPLSQRSPENMAMALNPRPDARARWQRMMVIRDVKHRGRITKEMKIARTERSHLAKSPFFKTSVKKLVPLARQIAGKSVDEALLQMRFSKKKAAQEVRKHLVHARNEAIVMRGMGLDPSTDPMREDLSTDTSVTPPAEHQNAMKRTMSKGADRETDVYIAQAWVNRGPYAMELEPRARGRANVLRLPHTGISVLLKEEKTRTREKVEKEAKAIRKRLGKSMWTQLPDRPVTRQSQYVLW